MRRREGQEIEMLATDHGYFPASFRWRGRRFDVVAVERCWTVTGASPKRVFQVRCRAGVFLVEQLLSGAGAQGRQVEPVWRARRWPAMLWLTGLRRSRAPRYPLPRSRRRPRSAQPRTLAKFAARLSRPAAGSARSNRAWTPTLQQP